MQGVKRIVCLANSRKLHGRIVAGREWNDGQAGRWIRPVSNREDQEKSEHEDGSDPQVLDIIDVHLAGQCPRGFQSENWPLDPEYYGKRAGRLSWFESPVFEGLCLDGHSTYHGRNDKIPLEIAESVGDSLKLVHVDDLQLSVFKPGEAFGNTKRRVQGRFSYEGT